jgi:hypothetical protein
MKKIMMGNAILIFVLSTMTIISISTLAAGATIYVPDNYATIQAAIDAAVGGDTVIVRDGTYLLAAPIDFKGKAITVRSETEAKNCILDGQNATRVVYFHSDEGSDSVLSGFTIQNGSATEGAGIYLNESSPTIAECKINANNAEQGGGLYMVGSSPAITNCVVSGNHANSSPGSSGGGIYISGGYPTIDHSVITGNQVFGNMSGFGGGIYVVGSSPSIKNTDISNNSAHNYSVTAQGGGIYFDSTSFPSLVNCIINGNSAMDGGGIYFNGSPNFPGVTNCTIARNIATNNGGGIHFNNTSTLIWNSILWENSPENIYKAGSSDPIVKYSDVGGGYVCDECEGNIDAPPAFLSIELADFHLTGTSPCMDAGSNDAPNLPLQDKDGNARINGSSVDMGAYEFSGTKLILLGRFTVEVDWVTETPSSGKGIPVQLTSDSGYFWFWEGTNVELLVKLLDKRGINGYYWFFYGALTDVEYTITVTDTETSAVKTYHGTQHIQTSSNDISAF